MTQYESRIAFREVVADDLALDCDDDRPIVLIAGGVASRHSARSCARSP